MIKLRAVDGMFGKINASAGRFTTAASSAGNAVRNAGKQAEKGSKGFGQFASSLMRIAKYRLIRTALKELVSAFKEGLQNAYQFSKGIGGDLAAALDMLSTKSLTMKNQLGSAFGALIQNIAPIIQRIIALVTAAANAIAQLFAVLGGRGTYLKAVDASKEFAKSTKAGAGAAKELRKQLMGFDEINRLDDVTPSGGGGGGADVQDFNKMFEETAVSDFAQQLKDKINESDWFGAGQLLAEKINSFFQNPEIDTKIYEAGRWIAEKMTAIPEAIAGFFNTLDASAVVNDIFRFFASIFNGISEWIARYDWLAIGKRIYEKLRETIAGIDFSTIAKSFFHFLGAAFGAAIALIDGFMSGLWADLKEYFRKKTEEAGGNVVLGFLKGIWDGIRNIASWIYKNIAEPFIKGVKSAFGIHSPSTVMEEIGGYIVEGLLIGITNAWHGLTAWIENAWENLKSWWGNLSLGAFNLKLPHIQYSLVTVPILGTIPDPRTLSIAWYANGGFPEDGLFMANHNELVGQFSNGNTAVANNEQIIAGIERGVYNAMTSALAGQNNGSRDIRVYLDGKEIGAASRRYERSVSRATGVSMA